MVVLLNQILLEFKITATFILFLVQTPGQFTNIVTSKFSQDLLLLIETLVAYKCLFGCVAGHAPHVLSDAISNYIVVLTIERSAIGSRLFKLRYIHVEFFWRRQRVTEI